MCNAVMKRRGLEKRLRGMGWRFKRHGSRHDIWTDGEKIVSVPRYNEIKEPVARSILRKAEGDDW